MTFGKKERKAQISHSIRQHYFITVINQHSFYINNKFQRGTMFKSTKTIRRKGNPTRRETQQKPEDLGALKLEMRWDTGVTAEGQLTAQVGVLGGSMAMVEFSLLQSKPIYPVVFHWVISSTDPGQIYSEYLTCAKDVLDSGDRIMKKTIKVPALVGIKIYCRSLQINKYYI